MYIQRALFLLSLIAVIFFPTWFQWATTEANSWYRPQLLWFSAIILIYLNLRKTRKDGF